MIHFTPEFCFAHLGVLAVSFQHAEENCYGGFVIDLIKGSGVRASVNTIDRTETLPRQERETTAALRNSGGL